MDGEVGNNPIYKLGLYILDSGERTIKKEGSEARLRGTPVDLFRLLVESRGRCIPREELFKKIWGGNEKLWPEENNLDQQIYVLKRFLGKDKWYIRTFRKVGYQFVGPVEIVAPIEQVDVNLQSRALAQSYAISTVGLEDIPNDGFPRWSCPFDKCNHNFSDPWVSRMNAKAAQIVMPMDSCPNNSDRFSKRVNRRVGAIVIPFYYGG